MASEDSDITAKNIPLDIVYEDSDVLVVNKAQGMVVHPAHGHYEDTLVNALLYHIKDLSLINGVKRPGIVHRIDKDTSGLLLVCKNDKAHQFMAKEIQRSQSRALLFSAGYRYYQRTRWHDYCPSQTRCKKSDAYGD